ncbi:MAG: DUF4040 domain-containing protein [Candidatus Schekmanbacteria bacterium]|nr:DUF4040 domain-containing protein [Candidatus Schekmanbacteria bacterium]
MSLSHFIVLLFLIATALAAIIVEDLLSAIIIYSAYSFTIAFTYLIFRANDVAMTEAAVGAGVTTILFIAAFCKTKGKESDLVNHEAHEGHGEKTK